MARDTVPVSVLYSSTGSYAAYGRDAAAGAMAAISEINADASLPFLLKARVSDPGGHAERYAQMAKEAAVQDGCRHIIGCITSWSRKDVLPVVERHDGQLWYAFPYEGYEANERVIYLGPCPNQHLLPLFGHVQPRFGNRAFFVGSNYIWGWEVSRIARELVEGDGGRVLSDRFVPLGSIEVDHLIREIATLKPGFVLTNLVGASAAAFIAAYGTFRAETPEAPPLVACNLTEIDLETLSPAARAGHIATSTYFHRLETPENRAFKARMLARHGQQRRLSAAFVAGYTGVSVLARAMVDAGTDEPAAIRKVVTSRAFETPLGALTIDARNQHAALVPHLALSDRDGAFDIFESAAAPIDADPYLVRSLPRVGPVVIGTPSLRVIK
ncbi:amino acid/amide ABC transporter substrate-binding protein, HAAT family [Rhizobium sp. RU20A]|uniref:transporter substrate-binding protein n=1 Tax=Rhizobium sp. RU20A TaxID=1907412 RepID=UPI000953D203|nr:transporter substrate-binding protein [Rhizobium sp. RU20A]SIR31900.1 amino acid/amide ABC transporter substrate-binding protein, HAAT family [Rhizobium sp. RU20A]